MKPSQLTTSHGPLLRSLLAAVVCVFATTAAATTTNSFVLDDAKSLSGGDLDGTAIHSNGSVTRGASVTTIPIEHAPVAYSIARAKNGTAYIGTGMDGQIFRLVGKTLSAHAKTGQLVVSALAIGPRGVVFAGTLPEGRIYKVYQSGKTEEFLKLPKTEHVWALAFDTKRRRLLAATGPNGKLFSIDPRNKKTKVLYDADAPHLMSLVLGTDGDAYVGTSEDALVVRVSSKGKARVVHDFPGTEVTALDYRNGALAVVANEFKKPPSQFLLRRPRGQAGPARGMNVDRSRPMPGKGSVFSVAADGRVETLHSDKTRHFTAVRWRDKGGMYVADGVDGRILRIHDDGSHSTWVDVEARQILAIDTSKKPVLFVTSDGATANILSDAPPRKPTWTSKPQDARFQSTWGQLSWRGTGALRFQTRSGNTEKPDATWGDWSKPMKNPSRIQSPPARFIQVRALFPPKGAGTLRAVEIFYLSQNQRARVHNVRVNTKATKGKPASKPAAKYPLAWEADNPDKDSLRYRLQYRAEDQTVWRDVFREDEIVTEPRYDWHTDSIPDGYYIVRVDASDERTNPAQRTERTWATSEPIRIDNHGPRVEDLRIKGGRLTGVATDELGPIARIEVAIDGRPWRDVFPTDQLLDTKREAFSVPLKELTKGGHVVAVRATDASGNLGSAEIEIQTGRK